MTNEIAEFLTTSRDGVFGPEISLNSETGDCCVRLQDGSLRGRPTSGPTLNAFLVWVGALVVVVSKGVRSEVMPAVADGLRATLGRADLSVVFSSGPGPSTDSAIVVSRGDTHVSDRDLARSEAFVLTQCSWLEKPIISVALNGQVHQFFQSFYEVSEGRFWPTLNDRADV